MNLTTDVKNVLTHVLIVKIIHTLVLNVLKLTTNMNKCVCQNVQSVTMKESLIKIVPIVIQPVDLVMLVLDPLLENVLFVVTILIVKMVNSVPQIFLDVSMKKLFVMEMLLL